ncbi:transposase [Caulobacter sp. S45]|uniref:transposase n=1 Tax=Caulobacter sp. S45 TaxID=1641861 RepID=UPI001C2048C2
MTGSPDESGARRREKGLAKSGNPRVRRGLIQLAWRFLMFQKAAPWRLGIAFEPRRRRPGARR